MVLSPLSKPCTFAGSGLSCFSITENAAKGLSGGEICLPGWGAYKALAQISLHTGGSSISHFCSRFGFSHYISKSFKLANGTVVMVLRESLENSSGLIPSLQSFNFALTVDQCFRASAVQTSTAIEKVTGRTNLKGRLRNFFVTGLKYGTLWSEP